MRSAITCLGLLLVLFLVPSLVNAAEPTATAAAPAMVTSAAPLSPIAVTPVTPDFMTSENWCGSPCSPNGAMDECIGYNACGWLQIDSCSCFRGAWRCVWVC